MKGCDALGQETTLDLGAYALGRMAGPAASGDDEQVAAIVQHVIQHPVWHDSQTVGSGDLLAGGESHQANVNSFDQFGGAAKNFERANEIEFVGAVEDQNANVHESPGSIWS
jgi:hypothetical protein